MSSSFPDSFDEYAGDSPAAGENHSFEDSYVGPDSFSDFDATAADSSPPIYASGGVFESDPVIFSSETNSNGPILPPPTEMGPDEGSALREWRRQNAVRIEEKEKREKELLSKILIEADEYKDEFNKKRQVTVEANIAANREKEKIFVASQEKFHAEADKDYWKSIADLVPKEVPALEKRKGKKEQEKKPSIVVVQGPKPGKPTDLTRMRQLLVKLKHDTPAHLKPSPPQAPDAKIDVAASASTSASASASASVPTSSEPVAVA